MKTYQFRRFLRHLSPFVLFYQIVARRLYPRLLVYLAGLTVRHVRYTFGHYGGLEDLPSTDDVLPSSM